MPSRPAYPISFSRRAERATLQNWASGNSEVAGFIEEGGRLGLDLIPTIYAAATPKGPVTRTHSRNLTARLIRAMHDVKDLDGILLALHGAMYTEEFPQADEEIVRRLRAAMGADMPLVVTHDFHANISPAHRRTDRCPAHLPAESSYRHQAAGRAGGVDSVANAGRRGAAAAGAGEAPATLEYRSPEHLAGTVEVDHRGQHRIGAAPRNSRGQRGVRVPV